MTTLAATITHPPKMPSLAGWWTCCGGDGQTCGREVKEQLYGETCPDCQHEKCDSCGPVKAPTPVPEESVHQHRYADGFHPGMNTAGLGDYGYQHQYAGAFCQNEYTQPVSFVGWWHCCECKTNVNPNVHDWTCPECYHVYCASYCYVHKQ